MTLTLTVRASEASPLVVIGDWMSALVAGFHDAERIPGVGQEPT